VVIWLELGADLHMAKLMPLPLTVSCFSKIQIGFTFLVPAHPGSPGKRAVKRVCVCVCYAGLLTSNIGRKFNKELGHAVFEICEQTDRHAACNTSHRISPP